MKMKMLLTLSLAAFLMNGMLKGDPPPPCSDGGPQPAPYSGMNRFALGMYQEIAKLDWSATKGNFVFSPYSLSMALGMCHQGAEGKTLEEMTSTLGLPAGKEQAGKLYGSILRELENSQDVSFRTANAIWWDDHFTIVPEFQKKTESEFLARLRSADFSTGESCEQERLAINTFAFERTQKRIKDLLPPNSLTPNTASVLVNAVHFLGAWKTKFDPAKTSHASFDGAEATFPVPMMKEQEMKASYAQVGGWEALELPFQGGELSFVAVLSPKDNVITPAFESTIWNSLTQSLRHQKKMEVWLPKFKLDGTLKSPDTKAILSNMGMPSAFGEADFSAMCSNAPLFIGDIFHKAFIEVKEEGAEAAAATAVVMSKGMSTPEDPLAFHADRPFIFALRHVATGAILFMGRVADPR